nr:F420-0:Gamma-glutamyl ligase [uncultured bacterium]
MKVTALRTRIFREGEDLPAFIRSNVRRLTERSIVVVTSKIVALSEGRTALVKSASEKDSLIKSESDFALKTKLVWLTIKDGMVMASAGIDESNADGKIIMLPKDSFRAAGILRKKLQRVYKIRDLGVLITDSRLFPLRAGVVGVALGYAGFKGLKDQRGKKDIFGRKLKMTKVDIADSLATAAVLTMGEAAEKKPLAVITDAPVEFTERVNRRELIIDIKEDLYQPLFARAAKKKQ